MAGDAVVPTLGEDAVSAVAVSAVTVLAGETTSEEKPEVTEALSIRLADDEECVGVVTQEGGLIEDSAAMNSACEAARQCPTAVPIIHATSPPNLDVGGKARSVPRVSETQAQLQARYRIEDDDTG